jgi:hypothetical protein
MVQDPRDSSGDYGYDTVHEDTAAASPRPPQPAETPPPREPAGRDDAGEDLGYDEAHDF